MNDQTFQFTDAETSASDTQSPSNEYAARNYLWVATKRLHMGNRRLRRRSPKAANKLYSSVKRFGIVKPILIDQHYHVVDGHGLLDAAIELGMTHVPVMIIDDMTPTEIKALGIALNKLQELGEWNEDVLRDELEIIFEASPDFELDALGFETAEIDVILDGENQSGDEAVDPADTIPAVPPGDAVASDGDVFNIAGHKLCCGDARDAKTLKLLLAGEQAAMSIIDPPYNVAINGHVGGLGKTRHREFVMASGNMSDKAFHEFLESSIEPIADNCRDGAVIFVFMDWRSIELLLKVGRKLGLTLLNVCVWNKNNGGMGSLYRSKHELVAVFKKGKAPHINNVELGKNGRYRTNVWECAGFNSFSKDRMELLKSHPTVKPVALIADAIKDVSIRGNVILDTFAGSGTTLIAAEKTGRRALCVELDPLYVDTAIRRFEAQFGVEAVHEATGLTFSQLAVQRHLETISPAEPEPGLPSPRKPHGRIRTRKRAETYAANGGAS